MKTLYISDLDGTLLDSSAEISVFTRLALSKMIENGTRFSVATARTAATTLKMLDYVPINVPIILMNGVSVYDIREKRYLKTHYIDPLSVSRLFGSLRKHGITGFIYTLENDELNTYYERIDTEQARTFIDERRNKFNKKFTLCKDFYNLMDQPVIYFSVCEVKEKLMPLYEDFCKDENLHIEFYHNVYEEGVWYLEACSALASKHNAVDFLRKEYGFEKVVSFGDNLNDLPMFEASDECYAVANAKPEVKARATDVIRGNREDGVARWMMENAYKKDGKYI